MTGVVGPDLRVTLKSLKLGQMLDTLPDRLALARQQKMAHADFLQLVLADEVSRREAKSASLRARAAGLDAAMRLDTWDETAAVSYDRQLWNELVSLRFLDGPHGALLLGPVGVGKTHLACALGHTAVRRRRTVHMTTAARLFKRLKAARLDNTLEAEMRRLAGVELLILDDLALQAMDPIETADFYQLCVERHQKASTIATSNRTPEEWLSMMADPLLAQSAVDRLASAAHQLIIEGPSYRQRQRPSVRHSTNVPN
jgi:DNA replication protein DnaC